MLTVADADAAAANAGDKDVFDSATFNMQS